LTVGEDGLIVPATKGTRAVKAASGTRAVPVTGGVRAPTVAPANLPLQFGGKDSADNEDSDDDGDDDDEYDYNGNRVGPARRKIHVVWVEAQKGSPGRLNGGYQLKEKLGMDRRDYNLVYVSLILTCSADGR
jgi:hypothetical protein